MSDDPPTPQPDSTTRAQAQSGAGSVQFGDHARVAGDVFTGDKIIQQAAPPIGAAALHQLPAAPPDFTGRQAELDALRAAAGKGRTLLALRGQGGVGKTALALVLAHEFTAAYPDAQLYLDLRGTAEQQPLPPAAALEHLIHAFEPTAQLPDDPAQRQAIYRSLLAGRRALILLDNARDRAQVEPLLPPPGCLLLVTSRQRFTLPGQHAHNLDSLPRADAVSLLLKIAPRIGPHADEIAALCGDLPLALRLAGSALAEREDLKPGDYARRLRDEQGRLKELDEVAASLALSYDLLPAPLQAAWCALAVFAGGFFSVSAAAALDLDDDDAGAALSDLLRYSMLSYDAESDRYQLHDLVRLAAAERLVGEARAEAERRHAEVYLAALATANSHFEEGSEGVLSGLALFDLERANIEAGQAWAAAHAEMDEAAARLCSAYPGVGTYVLDLRLHPRRLIGWLEAALRAARRLGDKEYEGYHLGNLGRAYRHLGEPRRAIEFYEQVLAILRELGNRRGEGNALGNLGSAYADLGEPRRAIEYHEQSVVIMREIGDRRGEGAALGNLGLAYAVLGEPRRTIEFYELALPILREIGDRRGESSALGNLGSTYLALGDPRRAIEYGEQSLASVRELGDRHGEAAALGGLGNAYYALGEPRRAIEFYELARAIARELGDRRTEAAALGNLGSAYRELGETDQARQCYQAQLLITREIGDRRGEANASWNLGLIFEASGELQQAIALMQACVDYEREIGHPDAEADAAHVEALRARLREGGEPPGGGPPSATPTGVLRKPPG